MNHKLIRDRPCRVMWSQPNPALRKSGQGNIFVKNLPANFDSKKLQDIFSPFGDISSAKIPLNAKGESNGYGFVQFDNEEAAQKAIAHFNGREVEGKVLSVDHFKSLRDRGTSTRSRFTNVFAKNLPAEWDEQQFIEYFSQFGKITSAKLAMDEEKKASKMFGFVNFENSQQALEAIDKANNAEVGNPAKKIFVGRALTKDQRAREVRERMDKTRADRRLQGTNLYIKNLPDDVDDNALRNFFARFGTVSSVRVVTENGRSKNFGFASFATVEEATKALTEANGSTVFGKPLYISTHQTKEQRRAWLDAQNLSRKMANQGMGRYGMGPAGMPNMFTTNGQGFMGYPMRAPWGAQGMMPMNPAMYQGQLVPVNRAGARGTRATGAGVRAPRNQQGMFPQQGGVPGRVARPPQGARPMATRAPQAAAIPLDNAPLDAQQLAALGEVEAKQVVGERLYRMVAELRPHEAPKITGMLLEMDLSEVLALLDSPEELQAKVTEAYDVLCSSATAV